MCTDGGGVAFILWRADNIVYKCSSARSPPTAAQNDGPHIPTYVRVYHIEILVFRKSASEKPSRQQSIDLLFVSVFQLFDMKKFQQNVSRELRRAYPDRRRLECQCLSAIGFVKNEPDMLDSPIWVLIINVVAMDMLKSKLPPSKRFSRAATHYQLLLLSRYPGCLHPIRRRIRLKKSQ